MGICEKRFGCIYITSRTVPHTTLGLYTLFFLERESSPYYIILMPEYQKVNQKEVVKNGGFWTPHLNLLVYLEDLVVNRPLMESMVLAN